MHQYGVREVGKLLGLPRSTIRALIAAGFVRPERGPRNAWLFSFRDLIVLRTAQALAAANVPHRRIIKSLRELRRHLPEEMPLSGLRIAAVADRVVVKEGDSRWQAESGQYLLAFEGDPSEGSLSVIERDGVVVADRAAVLPGPVAPIEDEDPETAVRAYEAAIAAEPSRLDTRINLGLLLHELQRHDAAEKVYLAALDVFGNDALLLYNFGVLLDDMGRKAAAMAAYELALRGDPAMADCHYNLALLCVELKKPKDAIRHMAQYRRLVGSDSR